MNKLLITALCFLLVLTGCQSAATKAHIEKDDKRAKVHYQIGIDALHKNQLPKAFAALIRSNELKPNQPQVLDALAYAWRIHGDNKKAESFYQQALHAGGGAATHTNYGSLLIELERYQEAEKQLLQALDDPSYNKQFITYINLGDARSGMGKYDDAIMDYRKAGLLAPSSSLPAIKQAQAYQSSGRPQYAQALYETLLRNSPTDQTALTAYLPLLKTQQNKQTARNHLAKFLDNTQKPLQKAWANEQLLELTHW